LVCAPFPSVTRSRVLRTGRPPCCGCVSQIASQALLVKFLFCDSLQFRQFPVSPRSHDLWYLRGVPEHSNFVAVQLPSSVMAHEIVLPHRLPSISREYRRLARANSLPKRRFFPIYCSCDPFLGIVRPLSGLFHVPVARVSWFFLVFIFFCFFFSYSLKLLKRFSPLGFSFAILPPLTLLLSAGTGYRFQGCVQYVVRNTSQLRVVYGPPALSQR